MTRPGQYETTLGQLGTFLAAQDAQHIEIVDEGAFLNVSWQPGGDTRQQSFFNDADVDRLREATWVTPTGSSSRAALLSALGHEIDDARVDVTRIGEEADGFLVSGTSGGRYLSWCSQYAELRGNGQTAQPTQRESDQSGELQANLVPATTSPSVKPAEAGADAHLSPLRHRLQLTR